MKAILVVDMPETCWSCPCLKEGIVDECQATGKDIHSDDGIEETDSRPLWCPLKPMPFKRKSMVEWLHKDTQTYESTSTMWTHEITEYDKGWNDCVEFIELGGEHND